MHAGLWFTKCPYHRMHVRGLAVPRQDLHIKRLFPAQAIKIRAPENCIRRAIPHALAFLEPAKFSFLSHTRLVGADTHDSFQEHAAKTCTSSTATTPSGGCLPSTSQTGQQGELINGGVHYCGERGDPGAGARKSWLLRLRCRTERRSSREAAC